MRVDNKGNVYRFDPGHKSSKVHLKNMIKLMETSVKLPNVIPKLYKNFQEAEINL